MSTQMKEAAAAAISEWQAMDPAMKILAPVGMLALIGFAATFTGGWVIAWWGIS